MKSLRSAYYSLLLPFLVGAVLTLASCGGGTTGTGGTGSSQFSGRILFSTGDPVANATVVVEETGDSTTANEKGEFAVESQIPSEHITLLVEAPEVQAAAVISEIPSGPQDVTVELTVDKSKNEVTVASKRIRPRSKPPRPKPTPLPTPLPTTEPGITPTPEATPLPEVEPTAEPTEEPEFTPTPDGTASPGTPDPTAPPMHTVIFRGLVHAPAEMLSRLRIGVAGLDKKVRVKSSGLFYLRTDSSSLPHSPVLELAIGKHSASVKLQPLPDTTVKVIVDISLMAGSGGSLSAILNSLTIKN